MKVVGVYCDTCHTFIYSRANHDYNTCKCGRISIDGGRNYVRLIGDMTCPVFKIDIPYSETDLFEDWNKRKNKLGFIEVESVHLLHMAE